jgi:hypothetical protein
MKPSILKITVFVLTFVFSSVVFAEEPTIFIYPTDSALAKFQKKFGKRLNVYFKGQQTPKTERVLKSGLRFSKSGGIPVDQIGDTPVVDVTVAQQKGDARRACDKALLYDLIGFWKHARKLGADAAINLVTYDANDKEYPSATTFACVIKGQRGGVYLKGDLVRLDD